LGKGNSEYLTTTSGAISIGAQANRLTQNIGYNYSKSIIIGDSACYQPTYSPQNKLVLENSPSNTPLLSGDFVLNRVGINVHQAAPTVTLDINGTDAVKLPSGTTAQRPTATNGQIRHNSTTSQIEGVRNGSAFESFVMGSVPATLTISGGAGTPEGVVTAVVGSMYLRTDGGAGTTLYIKETGTGNTGWTAK